MTIETATLLAALAMPLAVVAVVVAVTVWVLTRTRRSASIRSTEWLEGQESVIREELVRARSSLELLCSTMTSFRARGRALDADMAVWTTGFTEHRQAIARLSRGRLGPAVRAMRLAGSLARVALLWRMPAR